MSTQLHNSPIYGPVHSRRLGLSVGINLMPADGKYCTFDCIYCECGYNHERQTRTPRPTVAEVTAALERQLQTMADDGSRPDVLTFAGNGEPTAHPHFAEIVDATIALRNRYCPDARISVLSNATQLHRAEVREALLAVRAMLDTLGLDPLAEPWVSAGAAGGAADGTAESPEHAALEALIAEQLNARAEARKAKDFAKADQIRDALTEAGIAIEDGPQGSTWSLK